MVILYDNKVGFNYLSENIIKAPLKLNYLKGCSAQSFVRDEVQKIESNSSCVDAFNKAELC